MGGESRSTTFFRHNPRHGRSLREALNVMLLEHEIDRLVDPDLRITPALIRHLHQVIVNGVLPDGGKFREVEVYITGVDHIPPPFTEVPVLIRDFCDTLNDAWKKASPAKLAALAFWRIAWIHPFRDGNGRTARGLSYLVLCSKVGRILPGRPTVNAQMDRNRAKCIRILDEIDHSWRRGRLDLAPLTDLIEEMLEIQLRGAEECR